MQNNVERTHFNNNDAPTTKIKIQGETGLGVERNSNTVEKSSLIVGKILTTTDAASNGLACDTNNDSLVAGGKVHSIICNDGCRKTVIHSEVKAQNTTKSPQEENCNKDLKTLFLGRGFGEIENSGKVVVINVPARSNFLNSSGDRNECETSVSDRISSASGSELFRTLTFDVFAFRETFVEEGKDYAIRRSEAAREEVVASCRICHSTTTHDHEPLVSPCFCTGSMKYVHETCLIHWLKKSIKTNCELCLHKLRVKKSLKPFNEWHLPDEKPVAVVWLLTFTIALTLNIASIWKDASAGCTTIPSIVFYVLGSTVAIFFVIFLLHWGIKTAAYLKKWLAFNQVWLLEEKYFNGRNKVSYETAV